MKKIANFVSVMLLSIVSFSQNDDMEFNSVRLNTLYFKTSGKYLHYNNVGDYADFGTIPNGLLNSNYILHSGNFNSYAPTLTGVGASGSWNINAASATSWGGVASYTNAGLSGTPAYIMAYESENNTWKPTDVIKIRSFLGIPTSGETLQSVTDRGNVTNNYISTSAPLGFMVTNGSAWNIHSDNLSLNLSETAVSTRLAILKNSGNVGIGTTSPAYKLDVNGDIRLAGLLKLKSGELNIQSYSTNNAFISNNTSFGTSGFTYSQNGYAGALYFIDGNFEVRNASAGSIGEQVNWRVPFRITKDGNIGIGTSEPGTYKLAVEGVVGARKIKVTQTNWADYVFDSSYQLLSLSHVESFIKENKHLPEVPSAAEVKKDGLDLGDNQAVLLKKIEELTLYIIQQNKKIEHLGKELEEVKAIQRNGGRR